MSRRNPDYSDEEEARGKAGRAVLERYAETIREGMAESLWILAYADWADENPDEADEQLGRAPAGKDWADVALSNGTPAAAQKAAKDLYALYEKTNGNLVELYGLAQTADMGEDFSFTEDDSSTSEEKRLDQHWKLADAGEFGQSLAAMALGHGIGWFDDHKEFAYEKVSFECRYDGDELTWSGGTQDAREASKRIGRIIVVNDASFYDHQYLLRAGQGHADDVHYLLIGAASLEGAVDEMIDWIGENDPDMIINDQVHEAFVEALKEMGVKNPTRATAQQEEQAHEASEVDTTSGGNAGDYIRSEDWAIIAEDPSEDDLKKFGRERNPAGDAFSIRGVTNPARVRQIAAKVVSKCGCKQNPTIAELSQPKVVQALIREGLDDEFAQKVADVTFKPDPMGKIRTLDQFKRDLSANLAMGLMLEEDYVANPEEWTVEVANSMTGTRRCRGTFATRTEATDYARAEAERSRSFVTFQVMSGSPSKPGRPAGVPFKGVQ